MRLTLAAFTLLAAGGAVAEPPAATNPDRMPGDDTPSPIERQLRIRPANPTPDAVDATPGPRLALALEAAEAAIDQCSLQEHRIGVAILDSAGYLRVGMQADGAKPGRIYFASRKALAALVFGTPSSAVQARMRADKSAWPLLKPNMVAVPGAVPLMVGGRVVGAIGASGAAAVQDEACAAAGAATIMSKLG